MHLLSLKKKNLCPLTPELPPDHQLLCFEPDTPCLNSTRNHKKISSENVLADTHQDAFTLIQQKIPFSLDTSNSS